MKINLKIKMAPVLAFLSLLLFSHAHGMMDIRLDVDIDVKKSRITGTSRMNVSAGDEIVLQTGSLTVTTMSLNEKKISFERKKGTVRTVITEEGELSVNYTGTFKGSTKRPDTEDPVFGDVIDERGVSLTGIWYPSHREMSRYHLSVNLPEGYTAISEADEIEKVQKKGKVHYRFRFPYKTDGINLVASDKYVIVRDKFRDIDIYAYFFPEDMKLAKTYIEYTKKYLEMYEDLLGKYPYKRFAIVENFLPTGYSMPTFTLLGSSVVKLPFIVKTSLGHEIVHQWFGDYVYIDYDSGNWAEGLTTYLSDHLYREQKEEGWQYRKQMLVDYRSYVTDGTDMPLTDFVRRSDRASRAIGYGKTAMVFHMLKNLMGKDDFHASLKKMIDRNHFKRASWDDIRLSFEQLHGSSLGWFFEEWVEKEGLIELSLHDPEVRQSGTNYNLHFHVDQTEDVYRVSLPVTIYFENGILFDTILIDKQYNSFELTMKEKPVRIVLDEAYDIARVLGKDEVPPVIARLFGNEKIIIALPVEGREIYQSIIGDFEERGAVTRAAKEISIADIEDLSIIALGIDNPIVTRLYGSLIREDAGFSIRMKTNPRNPEKVIAVIEAESSSEAEAALRKIPHYGKYSKLLFDMGINKGKDIQETAIGIVMDLKH